MKRKIIKNRHQFKVNLPIELVRKMQWDENTEIKFHHVDTKLGEGLLILPNDEIPLKLKIKKA